MTPIKVKQATSVVNIHMFVSVIFFVFSFIWVYALAINFIPRENYLKYSFEDVAIFSSLLLIIWSFSAYLLYEYKNMRTRSNIELELHDTFGTFWLGFPLKKPVLVPYTSLKMIRSYVDYNRGIRHKKLKFVFKDRSSFTLDATQTDPNRETLISFLMARGVRHVPKRYLIDHFL